MHPGAGPPLRRVDHTGFEHLQSVQEAFHHLQGVEGFRGARLLGRRDGQQVMFMSITYFTSLDAVRNFAADDYELAVVKEAVRRVLSWWDERVSDHEVAIDLQ